MLKESVPMAPANTASHRQIALVLEELSHEVEALGASLCGDMDVAMRHMDSLQAIDKIRQQGVKVYVNSSAEKDAFRKTSQGPVIEFIAAQTSKELVDKLLVAVDQTRKHVYGF